MLPAQTRDDCLRGSSGNLEDGWQRELELLLQAQRNQRVANRDRDFNICRSGSAPPTVDGSLSAVGSLFRKGNFIELNGSSGPRNNDIALTEDEMRSHPAYLSYYYSHENINPRLPPPSLSKEDWRIAQRFQNGGALIGEMDDLRRKNLADKGDNSSLFAMQPSFSSQKMGNDLMDSWNVDRSDLGTVSPSEWLDRGSDCLNGLRDNGMGSRRKSFADILQKGLDRPTSALGHLSHATSHDSFADIRLTNGIYERHPTGSCNALESLEGFHPDAVPSAFAGAQNHGNFASAVGSSLSRSTTPDQQLLRRPTSFSVSPVGCRFTEKQPALGMTCQNGQSSGMTKLDEIAAALSGLSMSNIRQADQVSNLQGQLQLDLDNQKELLLRMSNGINMNHQQQVMGKTNEENPSFSSNYIDVTRKNNVVPNSSASMLRSNVEVNIPKRTSSSANLYSIASASGLGNLERTEHHRQNLNVPNVDLVGHFPGAYSLNQKLSSLIQNHTDAAPGGNGAIGHNLSGQINLSGANPHPPKMDPGFTQYLQNADESQAHVLSGAGVPYATNYFDTSCEDLDAIQKAYLELLIAQHKQQQELLSKASSLNQGYLRTPYGLGMPYPANAMANSVLSSIGYGRSIPNKQIAGYASTTRNPTGGPSRLWHAEAGNNVERKCSSSLLDEFKNNKSKSFELSDIVGHVIEFSTDQHGSRFIQQKLETATVEEKEKIFPEIIPCACTLMTDVFGNYVIQKFFKHGTESQKMELASQVKGHVLQLSLQMYGCRVIQKALEVVDVDQQTQMVSELDGSVMRCVRDQNGNHVIQKCIECVPEDQIQFIFSAFYGEVVELATHPYGCRVIQRVLEHCKDQKTQKIIMDEIMQSVCILAQDQYGNYVIQHVLEHGKPEERSAIISKLAGEIVKMSQQKFASNVVEKCLTFGGPDERQLLVNEMLGSTDENEPLQAMMKDPFGNYVVQKVLETCNDQSLELLLSRIKIHLNALKRYTYGKHIVSRVEKLIATGERRIRLPSSLTA